MKKDTETNQAKIRNSLSPFWMLSTMLSDPKLKDRLFTDPELQRILIQSAKIAEGEKERILNLLDETEK